MDRKPVSEPFILYMAAIEVEYAFIVIGDLLRWSVKRSNTSCETRVVYSVQYKIWSGHPSYAVRNGFAAALHSAHTAWCTLTLNAPLNVYRNASAVLCT